MPAILPATPAILPAMPAILPAVSALLALVLVTTLTPAYVLSEPCRPTLRGQSGNFTSPGYPNNYSNNIACGQRIRVERGYRLELTFEDIEVQRWWPYSCVFDNLTIYDGANRYNSSVLGTFCGVSLPNPVVSTGRNLYLYFRTDSSLGYRGFKGTYRGVSAACNETHEGPSGNFTSPGYPQNYTHNIKCGQRFRVARGHRVELTFEDFDMEDFFCLWDNVTIYDGANRFNSTVLGTFCGNGVSWNSTTFPAIRSSMPNRVMSTGRYLYLYFQTDKNVAKKGFKGTYMAVDDGSCEHNGIRYANFSSFKEDCNTCFCDNGGVTCTLIYCGGSINLTNWLESDQKIGGYD